ncbi:MAG: hypothetical protein IJS53_01025 [Clostridia bacterium]|nr:hypothetical protein [Clostridia bacterium]
MKCPQCGRWNRATVDVCFYCGADLPRQGGAQPYQRDESRETPQAPASVIYSVAEDGETTIPRPDTKDALAGEMQSFHVRRRRGEEQQRRIRRQSAESGYAPTPHGTLQGSRATPVYSEADQPPIGEDEPDYRPLWEDDTRRTPVRPAPVPRRRSRRVRVYGLRRFAPYIALLLIVGALAAGVWWIIQHQQQIRQQEENRPQVEIFSTIQDDMAAHTIRIPAEDGAKIYIKELHRPYIVVSGYAEVTVPDYTWYELENPEDEYMDVTLTPYLITASGDQRLMDTITYTIQIPESPLTLVSPDTNYLEVTTSPFKIQFRVAQNSTVYINGEDFSSFVNTQDGYISYNAAVPARGSNEFVIEVQCQYYRKHTETIVLYRAPQEVPLELAATLGESSSSKTMTIKGTTIPGATITVESDHEDLDTSSLNKTGEFSFVAKFSKIGYNDIVIIAERDGLRTRLVKTVYYVPTSKEYTSNVWPMDAANYIDFLNNLDYRVEHTQKYLCEGVIVEILSSKPQLALMNVGTESTERLVLIENMSSDTWVVGERYRVYADAYGVYDGKPRLIGRYTYLPKN